MDIDLDRTNKQIAMRGKYRRLHGHLCVLPAREWRTTFSEIESILGFELPSSARTHRPWWANQRGSSAASQAFAWSSAGWETAKVDMDAETLVFKPKASQKPERSFNLDEEFPVHPTAVWTEDFSLSREDMYANRTGGRSISELTFNLVGMLDLELNSRGIPVDYWPQSRYSNYRNLPLNRYGEGPFCRIRVARNWTRSGVYALMDYDSVLYVGQCHNLEKRWGPQGYGNISPRNCYVGGQETNCRINNLIYIEASSGVELDLWFHQVVGDEDDRIDIETRLVSILQPRWNL